jgi:hypothetical protein
VEVSDLKRIIAAALVLGASLIGTANADDQRVTLRGTVTTVDQNKVTLAQPAGGSSAFSLAPDTRVVYIVKTDLSAIKPGLLVGSAAVPGGPDGMLKAKEVHIFLPSQNIAVRSFPMDGGDPGQSMTNAPVTTIGDAKVDGVAAHVLTLTVPTGDVKIFVSPTTPIVTFAPADKSAIVTGAHVVVNATKHDDGTLTVVSVNVGKDGLVPPM